MGITNYRDLIVWQRSMDLVTGCYRMTDTFPEEERFSLSSQLRRAAVSLPANIAEGAGRGSRKAFVNHLWIANGSLRELETHVLIAQRLSYLGKDAVDETVHRIAEVGRLLVGLRRSLTRNGPSSRPPK